MNVRELKHQSLLQEWSVRIGECRSSGQSVQAWCQEQGIKPKTYYYWEKQFICEATKAQSMPAGAEGTNALVRIEPTHLRQDVADSPFSERIIVRHGTTTIELPTSTSADSIAALVAALNRHA